MERMEAIYHQGSHHPLRGQCNANGFRGNKLVCGAGNQKSVTENYAK